MSRPVSREDEPSAVGWIFGGVLGLLGAGAAVAAIRLRRPRPPALTAQELGLSPRRGRTPDPGASADS